MAEKKLLGRIVHKHDVQSNWEKATAFIPMKGEIIVYDIDDNYSYERFKIGDGKTLVSSLPFADGALREELVELINGVDSKVNTIGTLVGDTAVSEQISSAIAAQGVATPTNDGLMSADDKVLIDNFRFTNLGAMAGKTIVDLRESLEGWLATVHNTPNSIATFSVGSALISTWNEEDTTTELPSGAMWTVELKTYYASSNYALLELCGYYDKSAYYVAITNGTWSKIRKVFFDSDWESYASQTKAGLMSADDKKKLDGIEEGASNYEAYLTWGGKSLKGYVSPVDAAATSILSANRFQFAQPDGVTVEYSIDGGSTWTDYGFTNSNKIKLLSDIGGVSARIGGRATDTTINDKLRITLDATAMGVYTRLRKLLFFVTTNSAIGSHVVIEKAMKGSTTTFAEVGTYQLAGSSGWNSIPIGYNFGGSDTQTTNIAVFRLTFGITGVSETSTKNALTITSILAIGDTYWAYPSNMAKTGHLYTYDSSQNATFPAEVTATSFNGVATNATADASGNNIEDTYATKSTLSDLVGDTSVSEQIAAANMIYVGPTQPTDPNIKVWINTAEEGEGGGSGGSSVYIDETLTQEGWAADAKAVGNAINSVNGTISEVREEIAAVTESSVSKAGATMEGTLVADEISASDLTVAQVRNIYAGTADLEAGVSALPAGTIYLVYEG